MLQLHICSHSHLNVSEKTKTNIDFRSQAWVRPRETCWVKDFILPHKYHASNFYRRFWLTKNAKTNNNIAGYHLVSRCVISTQSDVQLVYRCPKRTFILPKETCFSFKYVITAT